MSGFTVERTDSRVVAGFYLQYYTNTWGLTLMREDETPPLNPSSAVAFKKRITLSWRFRVGIGCLCCVRR